MKLAGGYILASGADMCVIEPRVAAADALVEDKLQELERSGVSIVTRLGPNALVTEEFLFEDVIRRRIETERMLQGTHWVAEYTMVSLAMSKPLLKSSDLEEGRKSIGDCKRISNFLRSNAVPFESAISMLDANFTALQQARQASNWDPSEMDPKVVPLQTKNIFQVLSRFTDKQMPCILMHQDIHLQNLAIQSNGAPALVDFGHSACINTHIDLASIKTSVLESQEKAFIGRKYSALQDSMETLEDALSNTGRIFPKSQFDRIWAFALVAMTAENPSEMANKFAPVFLNREWPQKFVDAMSDRDAFLEQVYNIFAARDALMQLNMLEEEFGLDDEDPSAARLIGARKQLENAQASQINVYTIQRDILGNFIS